MDFTQANEMIDAMTSELGVLVSNLRKSKNRQFTAETVTKFLNMTRAKCTQMEDILEQGWTKEERTAIQSNMKTALGDARYVFNRLNHVDEGAENTEKIRTLMEWADVMSGEAGDDGQEEFGDDAQEEGATALFDEQTQSTFVKKLTPPPPPPVPQNTGAVPKKMDTQNQDFRGQMNLELQEVLRQRAKNPPPYENMTLTPQKNLREGSVRPVPKQQTPVSKPPIQGISWKSETVRHANENTRQPNLDTNYAPHRGNSQNDRQNFDERQ